MNVNKNNSWSLLHSLISLAGFAALLTPQFELNAQTQYLESESFSIDLRSLNEPPVFDIPISEEWLWGIQETPIQVTAVRSPVRRLEEYQIIETVYLLGQGDLSGLDVELNPANGDLTIYAADLRPGESRTITVIADDGRTINNLHSESITVSSVLLKRNPGDADYPDRIVDARLITSSRSGKQPIYESNEWATREPGERDHAGNITEHSLWFRWEPTVAGGSNIAVVDTLGSRIDTVLSIYSTYSPDPLFSDLKLVRDGVGVTDEQGVRASRVEFPVDATDSVYYIAVDGLNEAQGIIQLNWELNQGPVLSWVAEPADVDVYRDSLLLEWSATDPDGELLENSVQPLWMEVYFKEERVLVAYPAVWEQSSNPLIASWIEEAPSGWLAQEMDGWIWLAESDQVTFIPGPGDDIDPFLFYMTPSLTEGTQSVEIRARDVAAKFSEASIGADVDFFIPAPENDQFANRFHFDLEKSNDLSKYPLEVADIMEINVAESGYLKRLQNRNANSETEWPSPELGLSNEDLLGSVWTTWVAPLKGEAEISTLGSSLDTVLAVYTADGAFASGANPFGPEPTGPEALQEIAADDNGNGDGTSIVRFDVERDQVYYIYLDTIGLQGEINLNVQFFLPPFIAWREPVQLNPDEPLVFDADTSVTLTVDAFISSRVDDFVDVATVEFFLEGNENPENDLLGMGAFQQGNLFEYNWSNISLGEYRLWSVVTDTQGIRKRTTDSRWIRIGNEGEAEAPSVSGLPESLTVLENQLFSLQPVVSGTPPFSFQWYKNEAPLPEATSAQLEVSQAENSATYRLEVSNDVESNVSSSEVTVSVLRRPVILSHPRGQRLAPGETVRLEVEATGEGLRYQWRQNGEPIAGANTSTLELLDFQVSQNGSYDVVVSNGITDEGPFQEVVSQSADVRINTVVDSGLYRYPTEPRRNFWVPDRKVEHAITAAGRLFIAGDFDYVGPYTGSLAAIRLQGRGAPLSQRMPIVGGGEVRAIAPDGEGGYYIGGNFSWVNHLELRGLAHILPDGSLDTSFKPTPDRIVETLITVGDVLFVGGQFSQIAGRSVGNFAALDSSGALIPGLSPTFTSDVNAIEWVDSRQTLYLGGEFTGMTLPSNPQNEIPARYLVAFQMDLTSFEIQNNQNGQLNGAVYAIDYFEEVDEEDDEKTQALLVGGSMTKGLVAINPDNLSQLSTLFETGFTGATVEVSGSTALNVLAITHKNNEVFVGGHFTKFDNLNQRKLAKLVWDPETEIFISENILSISGSSWVNELMVDEEYLYLAGTFQNVAGQDIRNLARLDLENLALDERWAPNPEKEAKAFAPGEEDGFMVVGGSMISFGAVPRNKIAALDLVSGQAVQSWDSNLFVRESVTALATAQGRVYMGVTDASSDPDYSALYFFDADDPTSSKEEALSGFIVQALTVDPSGSILICAGLDQSDNNRPRVIGLDLLTHQIIWEASNGSDPVVWENAGGFAVQFKALSFDPSGSVLGVAGMFHISGELYRSFAEFSFAPEQGAGNQLQPPTIRFFANSTDAITGQVVDLKSATLPGGTSAWIFAGAFGRVEDRNGIPYPLVGLALYDTTRNRVRDDLTLGIEFAGDYPSAIQVQGSDLVLGGDYQSPLGDDLNQVTLLENSIISTRWSPSLDGDFKDLVYTINDDAGPLVVVGNFKRVANFPHPYLAVFQEVGGPVITRHPLSQIRSIGESVVFSVLAESAGNMNYQWLRNGEELVGATSPILEIVDLGLEDSGIYQALAQSEAGTVLSREATLDVQDNAPKFLVDLEDSYEAATGDSLALNFEIDQPAEEVIYVWFKNGRPIRALGQANRLQFNDMRSVDSGEYWALVINKRDQSKSFSKKAKVNVVSSNQSLELTDAFSARPTANLAQVIFTGRLNIAGEDVDEIAIPRRFGFRSSKSIWGEWIPEASGRVEIRASVATEGNGDMALVVFAPDEGKMTAEEFEDLNPDPVAFGASFKNGYLEVEFLAELGVPYVIGVLGKQRTDIEDVIVEINQDEDDQTPVIKTHPFGGVARMSESGVLSHTLSFEWERPEQAAIVEVQWFDKTGPITGADASTIQGSSSTYVISPFDEKRVGPYYAQITFKYSSGNEFVERSALTKTVYVEDGKSGNSRNRSESADDLNELAQRDSASGQNASRRAGESSYPVLYPGDIGNQILDNTFSGAELFDFDDGEFSFFGGASRWFQLETDSAGYLRLDTSGSDIRNQMRVWQRLSDDELEPVATDDQGGVFGLTSQVVFPASANSVYLIQVDSVNLETGVIQLNWTFGTLPEFAFPGPDTVEVQEGDYLELEMDLVEGSGLPVSEWSWFRDGLELPLMNDKALTIPRARLTDAGFYRQTARNIFGSDTSPVVEVRVIPDNSGVDPNGILSIQPQFNGGAFEITILSETDVRWEIQESVDLESWVTVGELDTSAGAGAVYEWEPQAAGGVVFVRAVVVE